MKAEQQLAYWKQNLIYIVVILSVWFAVSYLAGVVFADQLDAAGKFGGFPSASGSLTRGRRWCSSSSSSSTSGS